MPGRTSDERLKRIEALAEQLYAEIRVMRQDNSLGNGATNLGNLFRLVDAREKLEQSTCLPPQQSWR